MASNVVLTEINLAVPVPKETVQRWIARLNEYITSANSVSERSTFTQLSQAETRLHRARELFSVLWEIKKLSNWMEVKDELNRIGAKISDIKKEKHRNYRPEVRRS